mgnify:CR=1 FL=1
MILSKRQMQIINLIQQGKIFDAFTFLMYMYPEGLIFCKKEYLDDHKMSYFLKTVDTEPKNYVNYEITREDDYLFFIKDEKLITNNLLEYIAIVKLLEEEDLIIQIRSEDIIHPSKYLNRNTQAIDSKIHANGNYVNVCQKILNELFHRDYQSKLPSLFERKIMPGVFLQEFVNHNYNTKKEIANKSSTRIGYFGIVIALATSLFSIYISYSSSIKDELRNTSQKKENEESNIELYKRITLV